MNCVLSSVDVELRAESATSNSSTAHRCLRVHGVIQQAPLRMRTLVGTTTRQQLLHRCA